MTKSAPIRIHSSSDPVAWDAYVKSRGEASQYHLHGWLGVIERSFGHRAIALSALSEDRIVGILPLVLMTSRLFGRFMVSLPFVNYGGILGDDPDIEQALWNQAIEEARRARASHIEARHLSPKPFITDRKQHKVTMILDLAGDVDSQWKEFDGKLRNQIRKAERSGLTCRVAGASELSRFYDVFAHCMRDLGTPVYSRRFFAEVLQTFPDSSQIFLVEKSGVAIAAGIALRWRDCLEVPWAASLRQYRTLCPNNLLYWELIRDAIRVGLRRFDFGRSTPGDGPYNFKEQWGAQPVPLYWEYWLSNSASLPDLSPKNQRYETAIGIWKRLPVSVTRWLGPAIVRGIP